MQDKSKQSSWCIWWLLCHFSQARALKRKLWIFPIRQESGFVETLHWLRLHTAAFGSRKITVLVGDGSVDGTWSPLVCETSQAALWQRATRFAPLQLVSSTSSWAKFEHPPTTYSTPSITLKHKLCVLWEVSRQSIAPPARFFQLFAPFSIGCGKPFSWNLIDRPKDSRMQWGWPVYAEMLCWGVISACENSGKWRHASAFDWNLAKAVSGWINGHWSFRSYPILLSFHNEKWVPSELPTSVSLVLFVSFRRALKLQHCRHSACFFAYISVWGDSTTV